MQRKEKNLKNNPNLGSMINRLKRLRDIKKRK